MFYIRADANEKIATGHMVRCLAIAEAAREAGEDTTFIMADDRGKGLVDAKGFQSIVLNTTWDEMNTEIPTILEVIKENGIKSLFIDSYFVTETYLTELRKITHVAYIDDLNLFKYPVDTLICYASYYKKFAHEDNYTDTELLLGINYAPLRHEFSQCGEKKIASKIENVLLMSGGTDQYDIIEGVLDAIDKKRYKNIYVTCGIFYQGINELKRKYENYPSVKIMRNIPDIKNYMDAVDIAVTGAGTTLFELCAVGLPAISYILADNQILNGRQFDADGIIPCMGDVRQDDIVHKVAEYLERYDGNQLERKKISLKMQKYVDGKGAMRIAQKMIEWNR